MDFSLTTFLFEIVNFVVLLLLLQRLVFRPLRDGLAERRRAIAMQETAAQQALAEAQTLKRELEHSARSIDELRQQAMREASAAAAEERARILEQARDDAAADHARARRLIDSEREANEAAIRELAITHSTAIAGRLLAQLAREPLEQVLVEALLEEVARSAPGWRAEPDFAQEGEAEVTWARLPGDALMQHFKQGITSSLGAIHLVHKEDDALQAGAVLRFGAHVLDASVGGQLQGLRARARALIDAEPNGA